MPAQLQLCLDNSGCASNKLNVTVVSVFVPTHGVLLEVKERFMMIYGLLLIQFLQAMS